MKNIICFTTLLILLFASITFSQSVIDYQAGTGLVVQPGADVCADQIQINGTFSGGGTICGNTAYVLNLTALIEGFYNFSSHTMVPDTIIIYLRNAVSPFAKIDSAKNILNSSGVGTFIFFNVSNGVDYYIVLNHRNSIETWSSAGNAFSSGTLTYDFTSGATQAYGNNIIQVDNSPVRFAIYSGDVNQDGTVDLTDLSLIDNDVYNFISGYVNTDLNGDDFVDLTDLAIADNNTFDFVSVMRP